MWKSTRQELGLWARRGRGGAERVGREVGLGTDGCGREWGVQLAQRRGQRWGQKKMANREELLLGKTLSSVWVTRRM